MDISKMKHFVLKPEVKDLDDEYGKSSRAALFTYATNIESVDPELAADLRYWATKAGGYDPLVAPRSKNETK